MPGFLLASGQNFILDRIIDWANISGLYVGLITNKSIITENAQLCADLYPTPTGLVEIDTYDTCDGYTRQTPSSWYKIDSSENPELEGAQVTFTPTDTWQEVNGYFVSYDSSGYNALWAEIFPTESQGNKPSGELIHITPRYQQKDDSE